MFLHIVGHPVLVQFLERGHSDRTWTGFSDIGRDFVVLDINTGEIVKDLIVKRIKYPIEAIDKAGFPHYMLKEIYEIPEAMLKAIAVVQEKYLNLVAMILHSARDIYVIANGTSFHAGMIAGYYFRDLAKLNVHVISAAEFPFYGLKNVSIGTAI